MYQISKKIKLQKIHHFTRMRKKSSKHTHTLQVKWKIFLREKQTLNSYDVYTSLHYIYTQTYHSVFRRYHHHHHHINIIYLAQPVEINKSLSKVRIHIGRYGIVGGVLCISCVYCVHMVFPPTFLAQNFL